MSNVIKERREIPRGHLTVVRDALYTTLRLIAKHIRGFYGAIAAFMTVSLLVGVAAVSTFAAFASLVTGGFTQAFDEKTLQWLEAQRSPVMDRVMLEISALGTGAVLLVLVLVASVFLWLTKHHWSVYILLMGVFGGQLVNRLLKTSFERPRPSVVEWATDVSSLSFPSGHAMSAAIVYSTVAYLAARLQKRRWARWATLFLAAVIIGLISISRMYLGVHYPSDILAGTIVGLSWAAFCMATLEAIQRFGQRQAPEIKKDEVPAPSPEKG